MQARLPYFDISDPNNPINKWEKIKSDSSRSSSQLNFDNIWFELSDSLVRPFHQFPSSVKEQKTRSPDSGSYPNLCQMTRKKGRVKGDRFVVLLREQFLLPRPFVRYLTELGSSLQA